MRGKLKHLGDLIDHRWIIPAHAGQTYRYGCGRHRQPDHPRACGANPVRTVPSLWASGSSPRMRGKQRLTSIEHFAERIIPAHAGQTAVPTVADGTRSDHPRACGANHDCVRPLFRPFGSSPRMRGKHAVAGAARRVVRIIPAHAGQTSGLTYPMPSVADHPRACGANFRVREVVDAYAGSSPRMRGKRLHKRHRGKPVRIIPAHAGQTGERPSNARPLADHPRACGANLQLVEGFGGSFFGSSPRMRGKLLNCATPVEILRIIPAHAGQTP